jgi:hypothetical protein
MSQAPEKAKPGRKPGAGRWTPEALRLLGTNTDAAIAVRMGVTADAIAQMRKRRGVAPFDAAKGAQKTWGAQEVALLGTAKDDDIAAALGRTRKAVIDARKRHGIAKFTPPKAAAAPKPIGRPALPAAEKLKPVPVRLNDAQKAKLSRIGHQRLRDWIDSTDE